MTIIKVILIWLCISADNFSVSNASTAKMPTFVRKDALKFAGFCTFFHLVFFVLGWIFAYTLKDSLFSINYWLAFSMLFLVGVGMILNAIEKTLSLYKKDFIDEQYLTVIAVVLSLKTILLGFGLRMVGTPMFLSAILLAIFVFLFVWMGYFLKGEKILRVSKVSEIVGGIILIILSLSVLIQFSR